MYTGLSHLHHYLPYIMFLLMLVVIGRAWQGMRQERDFNAQDQKWGLFAMIAVHLQFTVGLILYFVSPMVMSIGEAMGNASTRLYALEHPIMMIIAVGLVTVARSKSKLATEASAHKTVFTYYSIALVAIVSRIPWSQWLA